MLPLLPQEALTRLELLHHRLGRSNLWIKERELLEQYIC
jgi:predicted DNA-binding protein